MGNFFPQKGTKKDMLLARGLTKKLSVTENEKKEVGMTVDGTVLKWNPQRETPLELELNEDEMEFLKRQIKRVDDDADYTQELLGLTEKIEAL